MFDFLNTPPSPRLALHNTKMVHTTVRPGAKVALPDGAVLSPAQDGWTDGEWTLSLIAPAVPIPDGKRSTGTTVEMVKGVPQTVHTLVDITIEDRREAMSCTRLQGRLALGRVEIDRLDAFIDSLPNSWALREVVDNSVNWRRTSHDMQMLGFALGYDDAKMDETFSRAMGIEI